MYACSPKYKPMHSHAETAYWKTNSPTISDYMKHPSILKTVSAQAKRAVFIYSLPSCTGLSAFADNVETLGGFAYGDATAPEGNEWNNPEALALNKEQPTATFYPSQDTESARKALPENSKYWMTKTIHR